MKHIKSIVCIFAAGTFLLTGCSVTEVLPTDSTAAEAASAAASFPKPVIVIDAGHGGMDGGGVSVNGIPEKGINLDIALGLGDLMRLMGYEVIFTRTEDKSIHDEGVTGLREQKLSDMENRLKLFNTPDAVCVSIHQNRFTDPKYRGAQMFYYRGNAESERLAEALRARIRGFLQPDNEREIKAVDDELYLLKNCVNPAVMAECGFISNPEEANLLEHEPYRREMSFTLMCGLNDFYAESGRITAKNAEFKR